MFKLKTYLKPYTWHIIFGLLFKTLEVSADLINPYLMSQIINVGIKNNDKSFIFKTALIIFLIYAIAVVFAIVAQKLAAVTSKGIGKNIRRDMFTHINTLSHAELDKFDTTTLINRAVYDVSQIENAIGLTIRLITRAPVLLIGSIVMALIIDAKLSLVFIVALPIIMAVVWSIMRKTSPLFDKTKVKLDNVTNVTRDNLGGIRVVRAFNRQPNETIRFDKANKDLADINIYTIKISSLLQPLMFMIVNFAVIAIMYFGGMQVNTGDVKQGDLLAFIDYFSQISMALVIVARIIVAYTRTNSSIKRVREVFETKNTIHSPANPVHIDQLNMPNDIEFRNVTFSYNNSKNAVENLNLKVEPGQVIGVIGGTGSGKSSVVNLIPRFYDTSKGEVLINGVNVKKYDLQELRKFVSIVPQNNMLFEGTIEENLRWRNEYATEEDLVLALKIAQAYDFVREKPDYLKTKVLRNGSNFSGGQKQRLCIARALVGSPRILILDDSSSALDFQTDFNLRKAIRTSLKDTTVFLVSQRANTLKHADNIIVMDNGKVVDIAKHDVLLTRCEVYKEIYNSQNKRGVK